MRDITFAPSSTDWLADKHQAEQRNRSRGVSLIMRNQFTDRHGQLPKGLGSRFTIGSKVCGCTGIGPVPAKWMSCVTALCVSAVWCVSKTVNAAVWHVESKANPRKLNHCRGARLCHTHRDVEIGLIICLFSPAAKVIDLFASFWSGAVAQHNWRR